MENTDLSLDISKSFEKPEEVKKVTFKEKLKKFFSNKRNVLLVVFILLIVISIATILILSVVLKQEEKVVVSEDIVKEEVYTMYDYVYNTEDNKLVATTLDQSKQLELLKSNELIVDYLVSPDKTKIVYSISDNNYKSMVTSENMDLTKVNFSPVAFKVYLLDLKTGENNLIYTSPNIKLGKTSQQIYHQKLVVYPDSYVSYTDYYGNFVSYPISYTEYVNDLDKGYSISYIPWDLSEELRRKELKLISINASSDKLLLAYENKLLEYDFSNKAFRDIHLDSDTANNCYINEGGRWSNNYLNINVVCSEYYSQTRVYRFNGNQLENLTSNITTSPYSYILNLTDEYVLVRENLDNYNNTNFKIYRFDTSTSTIISNFQYPDNVVNIENDLGQILYAQSSYDETEDFGSYREYVFNSYDESNNSTELFRLELPIDINEITYLKDSNVITYFRRFYGYGDVVIEYVKVDLETKESDELLYTKIKSDSVLSYKPKLVWLNID